MAAEAVQQCTGTGYKHGLVHYHSKATTAVILDRLDFKVQGNQRKNQTLQHNAQRGPGVEKRKNLPSSPVRDNRKHEVLLDLRCPGCRPVTRSWRSVHVHNNNRSVIHGAIPGNVVYPYFKGDMIVANADFELLLSDDVLFRPIRVIFP